jgi:hypothetical protein
MSWLDAIKQVFQDELKPLHYSDIAEMIAARQYRTALGATPDSTVYSVIHANNTIFTKVDRGIFILNSIIGSQPIASSASQTIEEEISGVTIFKACGIFWDRSKVDWKPTQPSLWVEKVVGSD